MRFRIFLTGSGIAAEACRLLQSAGCVLETGAPSDTEDDLLRKTKDFQPHALIVRQGKISAALQESIAELKVISKHGVGVDNIDIDAASRRRIPVTRTPGANFETVAEHTLAMILALLRDIPRQDRAVRSGCFDKRNYRGGELRGKILGLIGFGKIARRVTELVRPFGVTVLVYHPSERQETLAPGVRKVGSAAEIFSEAEIVSLHCSLNDATRGLINRETLSAMKHDAFIINTARGALINSHDLFEAASNGRIRGVALDVYESEPPPYDAPLLSLDNVILTPHIAGSSDNSLLRMGLESARNALAVLQGNAIDPDVVVNRYALTSRTD